MLVHGKNVIGLSIVTVDTGTVIETIKDVAYNPTTQRIEALFVKKAGVFHSAKAIDIKDVINIGEDAAIVADATVIKSVKELSEIISTISNANKYLVNTRVLTIEGKALGKVSDIVFNSETGYVDSMEVSQGGLKTLTEGKKSIKPIDIVTIGADTTIVTTFTELKLEAQGEQGGLKGAVNDVKDKAAIAASNAKEATQDFAERAVEAGKDLGDSARRSTDQLIDATGKVFDDVKTESNRQVERLKDDTRQLTDELRNTLADKTEKIEVEKTKIVRRK